MRVRNPLRGKGGDESEAEQLLVELRAQARDQGQEQLQPLTADLLRSHCASHTGPGFSTWDRDAVRSLSGGPAVSDITARPEEG